jgi:paraquat-inducible protein A
MHPVPCAFAASGRCRHRHRPRVGGLRPRAAAVEQCVPAGAMHINGSSRETTLIGAAHRPVRARVRLARGPGVSHHGRRSLFQIVALLYVLIPLWRNRRAAGQNAVFRLLTRVRPWSFMEVFMLGALVALVRLARSSRTSVPGISLWSCVLADDLLVGVDQRHLPRTIWRWVERSRQ